MSIEDQDFIIRQVQQLAKGLGKFLGLDAIKEILQLEQTEDGKLADEEIETILLVTNIEEIQLNRGLTFEELSKETSLSPEVIKGLVSNKRFADENELIKLRSFVEKNQEWLN